MCITCVFFCRQVYSCWVDLGCSGEVTEGVLDAAGVC